ncbi:MAG: AraC family transcriptional regulator [Gemmatimonadales bacterium]
MTGSLTLESSVYSAGTQHPDHEHDTLQLSLVLYGRLSETVGGATETAGPLSVVVKDPGVVHSDDFLTKVRLVRLTLPATTLCDVIDDPARSASWRWTHHPHVAGSFLRLVHRARQECVTFDANDEDIVDLVAAITARPAPPPGGAAPQWLRDTMTELSHSWNATTTVPRVAERAGVHPVYLARCVRRWFGTGLGEELRRLRLQSAAADLIETRSTVSTVAHANGFSDEPHLCRELGRSIGLSPRRYRTLMNSVS